LLRLAFITLTVEKTSIPELTPPSPFWPLSPCRPCFGNNEKFSTGEHYHVSPLLAALFSGNVILTASPFGPSKPIGPCWNMKRKRKLLASSRQHRETCILKMYSVPGKRYLKAKVCEGRRRRWKVSRAK
jgi:hypothetical protein